MWEYFRKLRNRLLLFATVALPVAVAGWWLILGGGGFRSGGALSNAIANEPPHLDSFSGASLALAVLDRESQRLFSMFQELRDAQGGSPRPHSPGMAEAVRELEELEKKVRRLDENLERALLSEYSTELTENSTEGEHERFLNQYLSLVRQAPELEGPNPTYAKVWIPWALRCARQTGRTSEFLDEVEHASRLEPDRWQSVLSIVRDEIGAAGNTAAAAPRSTRAAQGLPSAGCTDARP